MSIHKELKMKLKILIERKMRNNLNLKFEISNVLFRFKKYYLNLKILSIN